MKAGIKNVCVHKGLFPPSTDEALPAPARATPTCATSARRRRTGRSSTSSSTTRRYRYAGGGRAEDGWHAVRADRAASTGSRDLAEIPAKYGVNNVYGDLGQFFAQSTVAEPRLCAALMGMLVKGLGADHVVWGTDAVWTGAPQWQIEALRRLEIPEDMQKKYGFAPLGPADGPVKTRDLRRQQCASSTTIDPASAATSDRARPLRRA